jgi:hypothetical protein
VPQPDNSQPANRNIRAITSGRYSKVAHSF